jgi:hypothetical protein
MFTESIAQRDQFEVVGGVVRAAGARRPRHGRARPPATAAPAHVVQDQTVELGPKAGLRPLSEPPVRCRP